MTAGCRKDCVIKPALFSGGFFCLPKRMIFGKIRHSCESWHCLKASGGLTHEKIYWEVGVAEFACYQGIYRAIIISLGWNMHRPALWFYARSLDFSFGSPAHIDWKTVVCSTQIAVFFLTKILCFDWKQQIDALPNRQGAAPLRLFFIFLIKKFRNGGFL